jgi:hypothetical protein
MLRKVSISPPTVANWSARLLVAVALVGATLVAAIPPSTASAGVSRVTICHQVGNGSYRTITVAASALVNGHGHHSGDIIPSVTFRRGQQTIHVAGRNLGVLGAGGQTGAATLLNGCRLPAVATTLPPQTSESVATPAPSSAAVPAPASTAVPGQSTPVVATPTPTAAPGQVPTPTPTPTAAPGQVPTPTPTPTAAPGQVPTPVPAALPQLVPATVPGESVPPIPDSTRLVPIADCAVTRADGVTVVWFDYTLTGDQPVRVEWGPDNQIGPTGTPPRLFGPGEHARVISVETTNGLASWTLAGTTATSGPGTPDCDRLPVDETGTPATAVSGGVPDQGGVDSTIPITDAGSASSIPGSTEPIETTATAPEGCPASSTLIDGICEPVEVVRLSVIDNVIDCYGFGTARFAAINGNESELAGVGFVSELTPPRLDGAQPRKISVDTIETSDGTEASEIFEVRYVTAVTWSVTHNGVTSTASAGVGGARVDSACPLAAIETTGVPGKVGSPNGNQQLATTGSPLSWPLGLVGLLCVLVGAAFVMTARRPDQLIDAPD